MPKGQMGLCQRWDVGERFVQVSLERGGSLGQLGSALCCSRDGWCTAQL